MAIFNRRNLEKTLSGEKTQTRRTHKHTWKIGKTYGIKDRWFGKPIGHITITRKFKQRLGDISQEDAKKEGFGSIEEFKQEWERIYGSGSWNPDKVVIAYEYILKDIEEKKQ